MTERSRYNIFGKEVGKEMIKFVRYHMHVLELKYDGEYKDGIQQTIGVTINKTEISSRQSITIQSYLLANRSLRLVCSLFFLHSFPPSLSSLSLFLLPALSLSL